MQNGEATKSGSANTEIIAEINRIQYKWLIILEVIFLSIYLAVGIAVQMDWAQLCVNLYFILLMPLFIADLLINKYIKEYEPLKSAVHIKCKNTFIKVFAIIPLFWIAFKIFLLYKGEGSEIYIGGIGPILLLSMFFPYKVILHEEAIFIHTGMMIIPIKVENIVSYRQSTQYMFKRIECVDIYQIAKITKNKTKTHFGPRLRFRTREDAGEVVAFLQERDVKPREK